MSSEQKNVDYIVRQISGAGRISSRKMFGEYAIYCDNKVVALMCDDQLYIKPTDGGKAFIKEYEEVPPYPGAKPYFLISDEYWSNNEWLSKLIQITALQLPIPKKKSKP